MPRWTPRGQGSPRTFASGAEDWAGLDWQSGPGGTSLLLHYRFAYFIFCVSTHFSHAQEHWGVTEGYASFSGHAGIECMFPDLATCLPKVWLSVRSGCLIKCLFFWFTADLKCLPWMSATGAGHGNSHWVCQCSKGEFKMNVSLLAKRRVTLKYSVQVNWCSSYSC